MAEVDRRPVFRKREQIAALLTLLLGAPLVFLFTRAAHDGVERSRQTPLRAVLGDARYEALVRGEGGFPHYLGDEFLAPDFTLRDREGRPWRLQDHRGKVLVINFWSITCPPCVEEMPTLETLAHVVEGWGDVEVVGISADPDWESANTVLPAESRMTQLLDPGREVIAGKFGTRLFPETWIVDRRGVVRFRYDGALDWSNPVLLDVIRRFL
jgi:peroxiredoxin